MQCAWCRAACAHPTCHLRHPYLGETSVPWLSYAAHPGVEPHVPAAMMVAAPQLQAVRFTLTPTRLHLLQHSKRFYLMAVAWVAYSSVVSCSLHMKVLVSAHGCLQMSCQPNANARVSLSCGSTLLKINFDMYAAKNYLTLGLTLYRRNVIYLVNQMLK